MNKFVPKIDPIPFTQEGYDALAKEQEKLLVDRVDALYHLKKSRELGDLSENGYYKASRFKLTSIDFRLRQLKHQIRYGTVIKASSIDKVTIGCIVTINDGKSDQTFTIVGGFESNPQKSKISHISPLGKALLGKEKGETIKFYAPAGEVIYKIINIQI